MSNERQDPPPVSTPRRDISSIANTPGAFEAWTPPRTTWTHHNTPQQQGQPRVRVASPPPVYRDPLRRRNSQLVTPQDIAATRRTASRSSPTFERILQGVERQENITYLEAQLRWLMNRERRVRFQLEELRRRGGEASSSRARMVSSPSDYSGEGRPTQEFFKPDINF